MTPSRAGSLSVFVLALAVSGCSGSKTSPLEQLKSKDPMVRHDAVEALRSAEDRSAVDELIAVMTGDDDERVRIEVIAALGTIKDRRATRPLLEIAGGSSWSMAMRSRALFALVELEDPDSVPGLIGLWRLDADRAPAPDENNNRLIHLGVEHMLEDLAKSPSVRPHLTAPLIAALRDPNWVVRYHAAEVLGHIGEQRARDELTRLLDDPDPSVQSEATRALERLDAKADKGAK